MDGKSACGNRLARYATEVGAALRMADGDLAALRCGQARTPIAEHIVALVREFDALTAAHSAEEACELLLQEARAGRRSILAVQALVALVRGGRITCPEQ